MLGGEGSGIVVPWAKGEVIDSLVANDFDNVVKIVLIMLIFVIVSINENLLLICFQIISLILGVRNLRYNSRIDLQFTF